MFDVPVSTWRAFDFRQPSRDTDGATAALLPVLAGTPTFALNTLARDAAMLTSRLWLAALVALLARLEWEPMPIDLVAIERATGTALGTSD